MSWFSGKKNNKKSKKKKMTEVDFIDHKSILKQSEEEKRSKEEKQSKKEEKQFKEEKEEKEENVSWEEDDEESSSSSSSSDSSSSSIEDDEEICYICREGVSEKKPKLIKSPCECKGSIGKIHRLCLINLRRGQKNRNTSDKVCPTCKKEFRIKKISKSEIIKTQIKELGFALMTVGLLELSCYLIPAMISKIFSWLIDDQMELTDFFFFALYLAELTCLVMGLIHDLGTKDRRRYGNNHQQVYIWNIYKGALKHIKNETNEENPNTSAVLMKFCQYFYFVRLGYRFVFFTIICLTYFLYSLLFLISGNKIFAGTSSLGTLFVITIGLVNTINYGEQKRELQERNHRIEDDQYE